MSSAIAAEAQRIVRDAAEPVPAGETVKGQMRRAARALGYPAGFWRVRAAWNGEAGAWSAAAFEELRSRYRVWQERQAKGAQSETEKLAAIYRALAGRLGQTDAEFHRNDIDALRALVRRISAEGDGEVKK